MADSDSSVRWGSACAIAAGVALLVPLAFYFFLLPAAGSSATHAQDPARLLPWMVKHGAVRVALWWATCLPFLVALFGVPSGLRKVLEPSSPAAARAAELAGILGFFTLVLACLMLAAGEMPLAQAYGVDLVHLGLIMTCNLAIGLYTPPVGGTLFVSARLAQVGIGKVSIALIPMFAVTFVVLLAVTYIEGLPMGLVWLLR